MRAVTTMFLYSDHFQWVKGNMNINCKCSVLSNQVSYENCFYLISVFQQFLQSHKNSPSPHAFHYSTMEKRLSSSVSCSLASISTWSAQGGVSNDSHLVKPIDTFCSLTLLYFFSTSILFITPSLETPCSVMPSLLLSLLIVCSL